MKSLVFPIIGSLVIGGGVITAPIYAPFIEKAIEDSKEPGPIPEPESITIDVYHWEPNPYLEWMGYLLSDPFTPELNKEYSFVIDLSKYEKDIWPQTVSKLEYNKESVKTDCYEVIDVIVDDEHLEKWTDKKCPPGTYYVMDDLLSPNQCIYANQTFTKRSTYTYKIKFVKPVTDIYFVFGLET